MMSRRERPAIMAPAGRSWFRNLRTRSGITELSRRHSLARRLVFNPIQDIAGVIERGVSSLIAMEQVVAGSADQDVATITAAKLVIASAAQQAVAPSPAKEAVHAVASIERVVAIAAVEAIGPVLAMNL